MRKPHDLVVVETVPGFYVPPGTVEMVDRKYKAWLKRRGFTGAEASLHDYVPFQYGDGVRRRPGRPRKCAASVAD